MTVAAIGLKSLISDWTKFAKENVRHLCMGASSNGGCTAEVFLSDVITK